MGRMLQKEVGRHGDYGYGGGSDRAMKKICRGYWGEHADAEIEERYGEEKENIKRGEWGQETCRCYVFFFPDVTYFIHTLYLSLIYVLHIPYRRYTDLVYS